MRRKVIVALVVLVALLGSGAAAFFFVWQGRVPFPEIGPVFETAESPTPDAVSPSTVAPAPASPAPAEEAVGAVDPKVKSAEQPSFDVVRIEPTGEAVIAGRAAPGWKVSVEANKAEVAQVVADTHGEWTVVLDQPLAAGDHELTLTARSPDGAKAVPSMQKVAAAVPVDAKKRATVLMPSPVDTASPRSLPSQGASPGPSATLPRTAAVEADSVAPKPLAEQDKPEVYTILPGDTLWDIAKRYLGAGTRYPAIYQKNREVIRDPDLIHPDERVKVPQDP